MSEILNILGSVGFNWHVALANFFNFLIILFLLNKFFFKKLGKTIEQRHTIIERGLNQARDAERALASAHTEKDTLIASARKEGQAIIAQSETKAQESAALITEEATLEIEKSKKKLTEKEASLLSDVEKAFSLQAPALVAKLYAKTLLTEMTEAENNALISRIK